MEYALAVLVLAAVVALVVAAPLRPGAAEEVVEDARRAELEAAKEAKYREIRDAELDLRMGKLSADDHRVVDRELRAQAIAILEQIDELEPSADSASDGASGSNGASERAAADDARPDVAPASPTTL